MYTKVTDHAKNSNEPISYVIEDTSNYNFPNVSFRTSLNGFAMVLTLVNLITKSVEVGDHAKIQIIN